MTEAQLAKADPKVVAERMEVAKRKLFEAGAHIVIDTINDLPKAIDEINSRLAKGIMP